MSGLDTFAAGILGTGRCLPEKILTNQDLERMVDTSDEWIIKRTGISERRILEEGRPASELALEAARQAVSDAGITAEDLGLIIFATITCDYHTPSMACIIQKELGAKNAAAFDLNAACSGFVYGLTVANQFVAGGLYKYVLVIGCEILTRVVDWKDRNTCVLFGDGAGAAVIGRVESGYGVLSTHLGADGSMGEAITVPAFYLTEKDIEKRTGENKKAIWMDGAEVFKFAVKIMASATRKVLEQSAVSIEDLALIIPHQANIRIIDGASRQLGIATEKVYANVHKYGNISAASIPVALDEINRAGTLKKGDNIVLVGFGGGLTWASALIRWAK